MPISGTMSLWGLYQVDPTILDGLILPTGMDADNLKDNLLLETESMEILYPNTQFLKMAITVWAKERLDVWAKLYATTVLDYNPIENYDRKEEWDDTGTGSSSSDLINYSAGYNPNNLGTPPGMVAQEEATGSGNNSGQSHHSGRVHGNIGVTSSQQMLQQELDLADSMDIYNYIIRDFKSRFCIPLY